MWVHLDYTYFLTAYAKFLLGLGFLFWWPERARAAVGLVSEAISMVACLAVDRTARDPQAAYAPKA